MFGQNNNMKKIIFGLLILLNNSLSWASIETYMSVENENLVYIVKNTSSVPVKIVSPVENNMYNFIDILVFYKKNLMNKGYTNPRIFSYYRKLPYENFLTVPANQQISFKLNFIDICEKMNEAWYFKLVDIKQDEKICFQFKNRIYTSPYLNDKKEFSHNQQCFLKKEVFK